MDYLKFAKEAVAHVKGLNIQSSNIGTGELPDSQLDEMGSFLNKQFGIVYMGLMDQCGSDVRGLDSLMTPALLGRKFSWGNCETKSALGFIYLAQKNVTPIEMMSVGDDHVLIVLGRKQSGKIPDISTWGEEAVVCDPWAGESYAAVHLPAKMNQAPLQDAVGSSKTIMQTYEFLPGQNWPPKDLEAPLRELASMFPT